MKEPQEICAVCKYCDILNNTYHICTITKKIVRLIDWCSYYKSYCKSSKK